MLSSIRFPRALALVVAGALLATVPLTAAKPQAPAARGYDAIQSAAVYDYVRTLASPQFSGRLTAHKGGTDAAKWIAAQFRKWGLTPPAGAPDFLQPFPTEYTMIEQAQVRLTVPGADKAPATETTLEVNRDYIPLLYAASGDRSGDVVFVGWGVSAPELGYDDYAGVDVKGKWAMCFRGVPDPSDRRFQQYDEHRTRMKIASQKGALGIIYVYEEPIANPNGDWIEGFTPIIISYKAADQILREKGTTAELLRADLSKYKRPLSFATRTRARVSLQSTHVAQGTGYNVVGVIKGSDPALRSEYVVVGGHMDHCGPLMGGYYPGANDNASGTATAMEIGRVMALLEKKPKRSVVIVLFGGEEMGLKGSEYFVAHPMADLGKVVGMINFDMVGEGDGLYCGFSAAPPSLKAILDASNQVARAVKESSPLETGVSHGSDFGPFLEKGVPSLSFVSNGPHLSYHRIGDTIYRINPDMLADSARIGFLAAQKLADQ